MAAGKAAENNEDEEASVDTYNEWCIHQFQHEPTQKSH